MYSSLLLFKKFFLLFCFSFCLALAGKAQGITPDSLQHILYSSLQYAAAHQQKTNTATCFEGEWPSVMNMTIRYPYLGNAKECADANCFTVANLHNELAEIYLTDSARYSFLQPVITNAYTALNNYKNGNGYNFWRQYPVHFSFKQFDTTVLLRQPMAYPLNTKFIKKAANVVNDADDTSLGYYASLLQQQMNRKSSSFSLFDSVRPWIDENRRYQHWYNFRNKDKRNSGAFMTWMGKEAQVKYTGMFNTVLHNLTFFSPASKCYPVFNQPYIPYGTNDVDAVVNANVLFALAKAKQTDSSRIIKNASAFITKKFMQNRFNRATIYYPNRYHLHAATARAYAAGVEQLNNAVGLLVADIKKHQQKDGSFKSSKRLNKGDKVQSTVNALYALLQVGHLQEYETAATINKALQYLLTQLQTDENGYYYWKGGVFFSGGTVVKNFLHFKSDAYTTVMMSKCLLLMIEMKKNGIL